MTEFQDHTLSSTPQDGTLFDGHTFPAGHILGGKYKVLSVLGRGGMGVVYRVVQIFLNQELALKVLDKRQVSNESQMRRFQLEARASNSLNHPNLVKVHDFGLLDNEQPYLVMDLVHGTTLADHVKQNGPLTVKAAVPIFNQACLALAYAHQKSVIHRDIKPSNIMLSEGFKPGDPVTVKIVDFGIAKIASDEKGEVQALTRTGEIFGSPLYMSPEQCSGELIDHRTDIYSLGCTLFEALTGTPPHVGTNALRTMMLHQSAEAPLLREASMGNKYPEAIEQIVQKMIAKSPHERYQHFDDIARDLASVDADAAASGNSKTSRAQKKAPAVISVTTPVLIAGLMVIGGLIVVSTFLFYKSYLAPQNVQPEVKVVEKYNPNENTVVSTIDDLAVRAEKQQADYHSIFSAAKPIKSEIVMNGSIEKRKFVFPQLAIGVIKYGAYFYDNPIDAQEAAGIRYIPADAQARLEIGGHSPHAFTFPTILKKIAPDEFVGFVASRPETQFGVRSTIPGEAQKDVDNLAECLAIVSKWTKIKDIGVNNIALNKKSLAALDSMHHLELFAVVNPLGSELELAEHPFLRRLTTLSLGEQSSYDTLHAVSGSTKLTRLFLDCNDLNGEGLRQIASCPNLKQLKIKVGRIDNLMAEAICKCPRVEEISLEEAHISSASIAKILKECRNLKRLSLRGKSLDDLDFDDKRIERLKSRSSVTTF